MPAHIYFVQLLIVRKKYNFSNQLLLTFFVQLVIYFVKKNLPVVCPAIIKNYRGEVYVYLISCIHKIIYYIYSLADGSCTYIYQFAHFMRHKAKSDPRLYLRVISKHFPVYKFCSKGEFSVWKFFEQVHHVLYIITNSSVGAAIAILPYLIHPILIVYMIRLFEHPLFCCMPSQVITYLFYVYKNGNGICKAFSPWNI